MNIHQNRLLDVWDHTEHQYKSNISSIRKTYSAFTSGIHHCSWEQCDFVRRLKKSAIAKNHSQYSKILRKNSKTKRHGFIGKWIEPKLLTIYVVDEQGKKVKNSDIPITNDGTYDGYKALLQI